MPLDFPFIQKQRSPDLEGSKLSVHPQKTTTTEATNDPSANNIQAATLGSRTQTVTSLTELLSQGETSALLLRYKQSMRLQKVLEKVLATLDLPSAMVSPGKKHPKHTKCEFVLNVQSSAEASLLRHHIPQIQMRLRPHLGKEFSALSLRVRNRPSVSKMRQRAAPKLSIPKKTRAQLEKTAAKLTNQHLRQSVLHLLQQHD